MSKYKHIIWDWNGTLLDDTELCVSVINGILKKRNLQPITREDYHKLFDFPVRNYYAKLGFDFEAEPFEVVAIEFIENYYKNTDRCKLHQYVYEVLEKVEEKGISQSVLSATQQETLQDLIKIFDLEKYFVKIIGLDDHYAGGKVANGKSWIEELHFDSHEVLLIGDTVHDYEVAAAMGVDCVLVASGHHPYEKLSKCGVPVLQSLSDVLKLL